MLPAQTPKELEKGIFTAISQPNWEVLKKKKKDTSVLISVKGKLTQQKLPFLYKAGTRII